MVSTSQPPTLIEQKIAAFEHILPEFEASFQFIQDVHGQRRFGTFSLADCVRYLHALWMDECKTDLLSVAKTVKEYEGRLCLQLLYGWQQGETAAVVEFLYRKLDMLSLSAITRQLQEARVLHKDDGMAERLAHGRDILLNRGMNLMQVLDTIFALSEEDLLQQVRAACEQYGHLPIKIEEQLREMDSPLYSFVPHPALAQRNMLVMNRLGINVILRPSDLPGNRSWRVLPPQEPLSPFAEHVVPGYLELTSPLHNNLKGDSFVDRVEPSE